MSEPKENGLLYLRTCQSLRDNLPRLADDKGRLLPERALCEQFSVNRKTLRKALDELRSEGRIFVEKRRNYVKKTVLTNEIGVLVDCFKPAPYLMDPGVMAGVFSCMKNTQYGGRLLVPKDLDAVPAMVKQYNLAGLLWNVVSSTLHLEISEMAKKHGTKICCMVDATPNPKEISKNYVVMDRPYIGVTKARHFLEKGHERIAYLGVGDLTYSSFVEEFQAHGIKHLKKWRFEQYRDVLDNLPGLLMSGEVTAINANGGPILEALMAVLGNLDSKLVSGIELIVPYTQQTQAMLEQYPDIKPDLYMLIDGEATGREAFNMLCRQIAEDRDQEPVLVKPRFVGLEKITGE